MLEAYQRLVNKTELVMVPGGPLKGGHFKERDDDQKALPLVIPR